MTSINYSNDIKDSEYVGHSSFVTNSRFVFSSNRVSDSDNVASSGNIKNSSQIFNSTFVTNCERVSNSHNVNDSKNIAMSNYVVNSHSILNADSAVNSAYCTTFHPQGIKKIKNCFFVSECSKMTNSLFCYGNSDKDFYLFNQPIDESDYIIISNQLKEILEGWEMPIIVEDWPKENIPLPYPKECLNITKHYTGAPDIFWNWVETLPGFDSKIMYQLTLMHKYL